MASLNDDTLDTVTPESVELSKSDIKDKKGGNVFLIPAKEIRQNLSNWYFSNYANSTSVYIMYMGSEGNSILLLKNTLVTIFENIESILTTVKKGEDKKSFFQFQDNTKSYITKAIRFGKKPGSSDREIVRFKFVRVYFKEEIVVIFQNSYGVNLNTYDLTEKLETIGITMSIQSFLAPHKHLVIPKKKVTPEIFDLGPGDEI